MKERMSCPADVDGLDKRPTEEKTKFAVEKKKRRAKKKRGVTKTRGKARR